MFPQFMHTIVAIETSSNKIIIKCMNSETTRRCKVRKCVVKR